MRLHAHVDRHTETVRPCVITSDVPHPTSHLSGSRGARRFRAACRTCRYTELEERGSEGLNYRRATLSLLRWWPTNLVNAAGRLLRST